MLSPNTADDLQAGRCFGNYVVQECVGRGGMARVYRAEHAGLGKVVALKVMERERVEDPQWRARFVREAQSAAVVKHPHIVDVTDVGVEGTLPFLVMEYLVGQDLSAHLAEAGAISEAEMADLLLPIVAGLGFAHDAGVVHRDIKPSNIFLARSPDGSLVPKLLDFGIAKSTLLDMRDTGMQTATGQIIGTPMFMAPEALDGARYSTERSDQYSLGLVMYQCLTGKTPFSEQNSISLLRAVATGRLTPLRSLRPGVSRAAERLVNRALALDPAQRFAHVRELGQALFALAGPRSRVLWESAFGTPVTGGWAVSAVLTWPLAVQHPRVRPAVAVLGGLGLLIGASALLLPLRSERATPAPHSPAAALAPGSAPHAPAPTVLPVPSPLLSPPPHEARVSLASPDLPPEARTPEVRPAAETGQSPHKRREPRSPQTASTAPDGNAPERRELEELFPTLGHAAMQAPAQGALARPQPGRPPPRQGNAPIPE